MRISKKMIAACQKAEACSEGLKWISIKPRTIKQLYEHDINWFLWLQNILSNSPRYAYYAAVKPARDAYEAAAKPARDAYDAAVKPARDAYEAAMKLARDACAAAVKPTSDAYAAAVKPARDAYYAAVKPVLIKALKKDGWR